MSVKLGKQYIKEKLRVTFGEIEVYNAIDREVYEKLFTMIQSNSEQVQIDEDKYDIQVNNVITIIREMLIHLTNVEDEAYWTNIADYDLEDLLNIADGDFKETVEELLDIMVEIGNDIRKQSLRKLEMLNEKLGELSDSIKLNEEVKGKLEALGLNEKVLADAISGDDTALKEVMEKIDEKTNQ